MRALALRYNVTNRQQLLVLLVVSALLVALISAWSDSRRYPGNDPDGVKYVQAAQQFLLGHGLAHSRADPAPPWGNVWEPIREWPPGFPLMIAAVSRVTGLSALWSAEWISRVCWALLPAALFLCLVPLRLGGWAFPIALLSGFSQGFLWCGLLPRSDTPFVLMVCLALLAFYRFLSTAQLRWLAVAGLVAGMAYTVRTVGVALMLAVPLGLILSHVAERKRSWSGLVRSIGVWVVAAAIPVSLLFIRNVVLFGKIQPYWMPPSTIGVLDNIRWFLYGLVLDVAGSRTAALWVAWNRVPAALTCLLLGASIGAVCWRLSRESGKNSVQVYVYAVTLILYAVGSAAILIIARSTYQWGAFIDERYAAPIAWILVAIAVSAARALWIADPRWRPLGVLTIIVLLSGVVGTARAVAGINAERSVSIAADTSLQRALQGWASRGDVIVSDSAPLMTMVGNVSVRQLAFAAGGSCAAGYETVLLALGADPELTAVTLHAVMLTRSLCLDDATDASILRRLTAGSRWVVADSRPDYLVLEAPAGR